jgi:hypothetical protein
MAGDRRFDRVCDHEMSAGSHGVHLPVPSIGNMKLKFLAPNRGPCVRLFKDRTKRAGRHHKIITPSHIWLMHVASAPTIRQQLHSTVDVRPRTVTDIVLAAGNVNHTAAASRPLHMIVSLLNYKREHASLNGKRGSRGNSELRSPHPRLQRKFDLT